MNSKHFIGIHGYVLVYSVASKSSFEMVQVIREKLLNHLVRFTVSSPFPSSPLLSLLLLFPMSSSVRLGTDLSPSILLHRASSGSPSSSWATSAICAPSSARSRQRMASSCPTSTTAAGLRPALDTTRTSTRLLSSSSHRSKRRRTLMSLPPAASAMSCDIRKEIRQVGKEQDRPKVKDEKTWPKRAEETALPLVRRKIGAWHLKAYSRTFHAICAKSS